MCELTILEICKDLIEEEVYLLTFKNTQNETYHDDYYKCVAYLESKNIAFTKVSYPKMEWENCDTKVNGLYVKTNDLIAEVGRRFKEQFNFELNHDTLYLLSELQHIKQNLIHVYPTQFFKNWEHVQRQAQGLLGNGEWVDKAYLRHLEWRALYRSNYGKWSGSFGTILYGILVINLCKDTPAYAKGHYMIYELLGIVASDFQPKHKGINVHIFRRSLEIDRLYLKWGVK